MKLTIHSFCFLSIQIQIDKLFPNTDFIQWLDKTSTLSSIMRQVCKRNNPLRTVVVKSNTSNVLSTSLMLSTYQYSKFEWNFVKDKLKLKVFNRNSFFELPSSSRFKCSSESSPSTDGVHVWSGKIDWSSQHWHLLLLHQRPPWLKLILLQYRWKILVWLLSHCMQLLGDRVLTCWTVQVVLLGWTVLHFPMWHSCNWFGHALNYGESLAGRLIYTMLRNQNRWNLKSDTLKCMQRQTREVWHDNKVTGKSRDLNAYTTASRWCLDQ